MVRFLFQSAPFKGFAERFYHAGKLFDLNVMPDFFVRYGEGNRQIGSQRVIPMEKDILDLEYLNVCLLLGNYCNPYFYTRFTERQIQPELLFVEYCNESQTEYTIQVSLRLNFEGANHSRSFKLLKVTFEIF